MNPLRIGIVGAGGIARGAHLPNLARRRDAGDIEISAISDVNAEAAQAVASEFGASQSVTDWRALLPLCDAIFICVPTHLHAEIAVSALREGKAVFCEKPLARTLEQADAMLQAQNESGAALQVGFVRWFDAEWLAWRQQVLQNKIGRPVVWHHVTTGAGPGIAWFNEDDKGGGPFLDGAIHNLDFALGTFGPAKRVFCNGHTFGRAATAIDTGTATIEFESGDELMLSWSWGLPQGCAGGALFDLIGPQGTITQPDDGTPDADGNRKFFVNRAGGERNEIAYPANAIASAYRDQVDEFIAVAQGQAQTRCDGVKAHETLKLALAILQSARSKQIVEM